MKPLPPAKSESPAQPISGPQSEAVRKLKEWHDKFGVPNISTPCCPTADRRELRIRLINEEAEEFEKASLERDVVEAADALADLLYVVYGAALEWGIPIDAVFDEVHRSNMTKVWPDGTVHYREDGKVLKPPTYSPANIAAILWPANAPAPPSEAPAGGKP